jgi:hypothetical protein
VNLSGLADTIGRHHVVTSIEDAFALGLGNVTSNKSMMQ